MRRGDPATDHRVDLYALGATAYEMLTGRAMFAQRSPAQLLMAHVAEAPEPIAKLAPATPPELASLVHQLLAKHPNDRPARAQDVADALGQMLTRWTSGELPPARGHMTAPRALALWAAAFVGLGVAAWLGVRWLPIPEWTLPAVLLLMVAALPVLFLSVWLHRPAKPVVTLPSVASSTTVGKLEAIARPLLTWRRTTRAALVAVSVVVLLAGSWAGSRAFGIGPAATLRSRGVVGEQDRVFIADFDSPATDTALGSVVTELVRTAIGRSSIPMVDPSMRRYALIALGRKESEHVGAALARDVARRANAKVYLSGGLTQVGTGYLIRATLLETSSGNELGAFTQPARNADDIISGIDHLGRQIRDQLGASLREVRGDPPLQFAVTPSLAAARAYTAALEVTNRGAEMTTARQYMERAVELDTEFAMAYRSLAVYAQNAGDRERADWAAQRAFRYREKLIPALQHMIEGTYYNSPSGFDLDKSIAAYEAAIEEVPGYAGAVNNLGLAYRRKRAFEIGMENERRHWGLDSVSYFAAANIPVPFWAAGHRDEARTYVARFARTMPRSFNLKYAQTRLAFWSLLPDSAERLLLRTSDFDSLSAAQRSRIEIGLALARRWQGKLQSAVRSRERAAALNPAIDTVLRVSAASVFAATVLAFERGDAAGARRLLDSVVRAHPAGTAGAQGYPWLVLAESYAHAGDAAKAKALLAAFEQRATANMLVFDRQRHQLARGWTAIAEKRYADAIVAFKAADVGECTSCALGPLAHAYDLAGQPDSAIATYQRFLRVDDTARELSSEDALADVMPPFLPVAYRRLGELYDAKGDLAHAREYYAKFIELWKDADPELRRDVVDPIRRRLAALQPG